MTDRKTISACWGRAALWIGAFVLTSCSGVAADGPMEIRYWVEPCERPETSCQAGDPELGQWAIEAWERASEGALRFVRVEQMRNAELRLHWASAAQGQYGEMRPFQEDGISGAELFVRPDLSAMGPEIAGAAVNDPLLREAIVYLTCLHESGHALGLAHTDAFADIMYSFQFGGDIPEYFGRYRRLLQTRDDIARNPGMSDQDRARLKSNFPLGE